MEGPRSPGYYGSVTGERPPDERDGERGRGPVALYGEVHRYGPRQARKTYALRVLFGMRLPDVELVWTGPKLPVPEDVGSAEWQRVMRKCQAVAEAQAKRFSLRDPQARGTRGEDEHD